MSRTRAERRHNTAVKTSARKALAIRGEIGLFPVYGYCGGKIAANGEASGCPYCDYSDRIEEHFNAIYRKTQLSEFIKSFDD